MANINYKIQVVYVSKVWGANFENPKKFLSEGEALNYMVSLSKISDGFFVSRKENGKWSKYSRI